VVRLQVARLRVLEATMPRREVPLLALVRALRLVPRLVLALLRARAKAAKVARAVRALLVLPELVPLVPRAPELEPPPELDRRLAPELLLELAPPPGLEQLPGPLALALLLELVPRLVLRKALLARTVVPLLLPPRRKPLPPPPRRKPLLRKRVPPQRRVRLVQRRRVRLQSARVPFLPSSRVRCPCWRHSSACSGYGSCVHIPVRYAESLSFVF